MDRIEKKILLRAPRSRVWQALTQPREFGAWFGVKLEGAFEVGMKAAGPMTHPGYEHVTWEVTVETLEPEHTFAFRWHPYATDPDHDYSDEPTTLVEFTLADSEGGTLLTVVESGFDRIPEARRREAFIRNERGWEAQVKNIDRYLGAAAA